MSCVLLVRSAICLSSLALTGCGGDVESDRAGPTGFAGQGGSPSSDGGGLGGAGGDSGTAVTGTCKSQRGSKMVRVEAGDRSFCIDVTEATNAEYAQFLDGVAVDPVAAHPGCEYDSEFTPWWAWPPSPGKDTLPVRNVDFCDAAAYCTWSGKRLCRSAGGGSLSWKKWTLDGPDFPPLHSEWAIACSSNGEYKFTYGNEPSPTKCQNTTLGGDGPVAVASMPECHPPGDGSPASIFDLSGNLAEWEDGCDGAFGKDDNCLIRGGSYRDLPEEQACLAADFRPRANQDFILGIRCCADPH